MATYDWYQTKKAKFFVRNASFTRIKGKFTVQPYVDLKGKTNIRQSTTRSLKAVTTLRRSTTKALKCGFNVNHKLNVKGQVFLSHKTWLNQGLTDLALIDAGVLS